MYFHKRKAGFLRPAFSCCKIFLKNFYKASRTEENLTKLAEWFEAYGTEYWNGEYYTVAELDGRLFPIYADEDNENGGYDIIGWELN